MIIRQANPLDAADLAALEKTQALCAHWGEVGWKEELGQASSHVWIALEEEKLVGFVALRLAAGFVEILNVAVHPQYCRRGIGFQLLSRALRELKALGAERFTLEVNIHNRAAISLYSKIGFLEVGRREKFYNNAQDALIMGMDV